MTQAHPKKILRIALHLPATSFDNEDNANVIEKLMSSHEGVRQFTKSTYNYFLQKQAQEAFVAFTTYIKLQKEKQRI